MTPKDRLRITLKSRNLPDQLQEARRQIDNWLTQFPVPSKRSGKRQSLYMASYDPLVYELHLVPAEEGEPRGIL